MTELFLLCRPTTQHRGAPRVSGASDWEWHLSENELTRNLVFQSVCHHMSLRQAPKNTRYYFEVRPEFLYRTVLIP